MAGKQFNDLEQNSTSVVKTVPTLYYVDLINVMNARFTEMFAFDTVK